MAGLLEQFAAFVQQNKDGELEFDMTSLMAAAQKVAAKAPKRRVRQPVAAEHRCCARVWSNGTGAQCSNRKKDGCGDYCKKHHQQSLIADGKMFQFNEAGKHIGLFWGRFDQLNEDGTIPFIVDDRIVCQWKNDANRAAVANARRAGIQFHECSGECKKKVQRVAKAATSTKKTRRAKNAYMFYLDSVRAEIRTALESEIDQVRVTDIARRAGAMWKALDEEARAPFVQMAAEAKKEKQAETLLDQDLIKAPELTRRTVTHMECEGHCRRDSLGSALRLPRQSILIILWRPQKGKTRRKALMYLNTQLRMAPYTSLTLRTTSTTENLTFSWDHSINPQTRSLLRLQCNRSLNILLKKNYVYPFIDFYFIGSIRILYGTLYIFYY